MIILENIDVILSIICAIGSIVMFLKSKHEKDECIKIRTEIRNEIKVNGDANLIKSHDEFNIQKVNTFDNSKSIK